MNCFTGIQLLNCLPRFLCTLFFTLCPSYRISLPRIGISWTLALCVAGNASSFFSLNTSREKRLQEREV